MTRVSVCFVPQLLEEQFARSSPVKNPAARKPKSGLSHQSPSSSSPGVHLIPARARIVVDFLGGQRCRIFHGIPRAWMTIQSQRARPLRCGREIHSPQELRLRRTMDATTFASTSVHREIPRNFPTRVQAAKGRRNWRLKTQDTAENGR